jgi:t-SNARE complex subunit (syntaxin)
MDEQNQTPMSAPETSAKKSGKGLLIGIVVVVVVVVLLFVFNVI